MKRFLFIILFLSLILLSACSKTNSNDTSNKSTENDHEKTEESESENVFSLGDFEVVNSKKEIGTLESGPISVKVHAISLQRGEMNSNLSESLPKGEAEFIRMDMTVISEKNNLTFDEKHFQLKTKESEEWIEPNLLMSGNLRFGYRDPGEYRAQATYLLDEVSIEDIKSMTLRIKPPLNGNNEPLGEDQTITVNF